MIFKIQVTHFALEQIQNLDEKTKRVVEDKVRLLKTNPYRYKRLHGYGLKLFRIRLKVQHKESRLVYTVIEPDVVLLCFLERDKDYRELERIVRDFIR